MYIMIIRNIYKYVFLVRSKIRLMRYQLFNQAQYNSPGNYKIGFLCKKTHPVTLGPEQLSRFFTYIANTEN